MLDIYFNQQVLPTTSNYYLRPVLLVSSEEYRMCCLELAQGAGEIQACYRDRTSFWTLHYKVDISSCWFKYFHQKLLMPSGPVIFLTLMAPWISSAAFCGRTISGFWTFIHNDSQRVSAVASGFYAVCWKLIVLCYTLSFCICRATLYLDGS